MKRALPILLTVAACSGASVPSISSIELTFPDPPPPIDEVACDALLGAEDVANLFGHEADLVRKSASSCFWVFGADAVQLVINTSQFVPSWRDQILGGYTRQIPDSDPAIWAEPGGDSLAIFSEDRGMIVHGIRDERLAVDVLRLAFSRLR